MGPDPGLPQSPLQALLVLSLFHTSCEGYNFIQGWLGFPLVLAWTVPVPGKPGWIIPSSFLVYMSVTALFTQCRPGVC